MENYSSVDISGFNHTKLLVLWDSGEEGHNKLRQLLPNLPEGFISLKALYESYQEIKGSVELQDPLTETETQEADQYYDEPLQESYAAA